MFHHASAASANALPTDDQPARYNNVERCRLILAELTEATGETTDLAVLRGTGMLFLDQVPGLYRLRTVSSVGEVFPLTTTANGRACLALMPQESARRLIESEWSRTETDGDIDGILAILDDVRESGLAYDLDEHTTGISAIGFAFRDWNGDLLAISVPIPSTRFRDSHEKIEDALRKAHRDVEEMISGETD